MTTPTDTPALIDDATICRVLSPLLECAIRRQLWLMFLDEDDRIAGPFMPNDDYPLDPVETTRTEDLGVVPNAELLAKRFGMLMREFGFAKLLVTWERCGGSRIDPATLAWARAFGEALRAEGVVVRAQLLLHDAGLRVLAPDDLV